MYPIFQSNTELLININDSQDYHAGEIVCFLQKKGLIVHRITSESLIKNKKSFSLKGDNNTSSDGQYISKNIHGKVTHIINDNHILFHKKGRLIHKFIAKISNVSEKNKLLSLFFKPLKHSSVYLLELLNINTGSKELKKIVSALKTGKIKIEKNEININLLNFLSLKNKFLKFSKLDQQKNIQQEFFTKALNLEKQKIFDLLHKKNIKFVSLDSIDNNSVINGSDIDILIDYKQLLATMNLLRKNNYSIKCRPPQEITLVNSKNSIQIDLHFFINLPRMLYFNKIKSHKFTKNYLQAFFDNKHSQEYKNEYFVLGKIVCFWTNDFLRGLNTLYDLGNFIKNNDISWKKLEYVSKKNNFLGEMQLVLLIWKNIFKDISFDNYLNNINLKTKIVSHYYSTKKIGLFGSITKWWREDDKHTHNINLECYIASLLVNKKTPILRLIRPRILLFFIKALINFCILPKEKTN
ncbi:hypothetical protein HOC11_01405 [archaeon]|nr:hypothetical protein [archaeon]